MFGMGDMMKKVQEMQAQMQALQEELQNAEIDGSAGGGLVTVTLNGKGDMRAVRVDPSLIKPDEREMMEDLILAAHQNAREKVEEMTKKRTEELTGGLGIPLPPGLKL